MPHSAGEQAARWTPLDALALAAVAALALLHLPFPFTGDQALFAYAAKGMSAGDRLYVDVWDVKQPGIFLFYWLSGALFGFTERGIHTGEVLWHLVFARYVQVVLRAHVRNPWVASFAPVLTVGSFYATASALELTQVEALVALPLLGIAAVSVKPIVVRRDLVWAAALTGVVGYLKLLYLPLPLAMLAVGRGWRLREIGVFSAVLLTMTVPILAYALSLGITRELFWLYFILPGQTLETIARPADNLPAAVWIVTHLHAWLYALAAGAVLAAVRERDVDRFTVVCLVWLGVGWALFLVQHWWSYHLALPLFPLGILAALGLDRVRVAWGKFAPVAVAAGVLMLLSPLRTMTVKGRTLVTEVSRGGVESYFKATSHGYALADTALSALKALGPSNGPIHVLGDPIIQFRSGRDHAIALNGWSPAQFSAALWERHRVQLAAAVGKGQLDYLYLSKRAEGYWRERSPETWTWAEVNFCIVARLPTAAWLQPCKDGIVRRA